jgi:uncharacterized protein (TIGR00290 family)
MTERVLFAWSGGKDSSLALHEIHRTDAYRVTTLLTTVTEDYDRISMHGVRRQLLEKQAGSLGYPLEAVLIPKSCTNEEYEATMQGVLERWSGHGVTGVVFGDVFLEDIRAYRERNLSRIGMKGVFPLWRSDTSELAQRFINLGFKAVVTCVDSEVLSGEYVGRDYDKQFLEELPEAVDPCGENGEFHTFVYDGPIFQERVDVARGEIVLRENRFYYCDLVAQERTQEGGPSASEDNAASQDTPRL